MEFERRRVVLTYTQVLPRDLLWVVADYAEATFIEKFARLIDNTEGEVVVTIWDDQSDPPVGSPTSTDWGRMIIACDRLPPLTAMLPGEDYMLRVNIDARFGSNRSIRSTTTTNLRTMSDRLEGGRFHLRHKKEHPIEISLKRILCERIKAW